MSESISKCDVVIVGAGFAGLFALYRMRSLGLSAIVLEQGTDIGGTWFWNRYPGARCDVESLQYSYSFSDEVQREWSWSEKFASQAEILRYINFVADKFDLRGDIELSARVTSADYHESDSRWTVTTEAGQVFDAQFLIFATGPLSVPLVPDVPGLDTFKGDVYRTSTWPKHDVDLRGKRVAVLGTGSSGIQVIPAISGEVAELFVLQRTPNYVVPGYNGPMDPAYERDWKSHYAQRRAAAVRTRSNNLFAAGTIPGAQLSTEKRERDLEASWRIGGLGFNYVFPDLSTDADVNKHASDFVRRKIVEKVRDPEVAGRLLPTEYGFGGRRVCVDNGYYETFNRDNVTLVDLRAEPIETMTEYGFRTVAADYRIDTLILAAGFDAFTGALARIVIRGRHGITLRDKWRDGPLNYLGMAVSGFPNMFMIAGPGGPSVLSNVVISVEQQVEWIAGCLKFMGDSGVGLIDARGEAEQKWCAHLSALSAGKSISKTKSWYTGANVEGKSGRYLLYMGGTANYLDELREHGYSGFDLA